MKLGMLLFRELLSLLRCIASAPIALSALCPMLLPVSLPGETQTAVRDDAHPVPWFLSEELREQTNMRYCKLCKHDFQP